MNAEGRYLAVREPRFWAVDYLPAGFSTTRGRVAAFWGMFGRLRARRRAAKLNRGQR